jgi:hypothetical protein
VAEIAILFLWNKSGRKLFAVDDQPRTETIVTLLKPVSLAFAAASLVAIAGFAPAQAQMGNTDQGATYPGPAPTQYSNPPTGYYNQGVSSAPAPVGNTAQGTTYSPAPTGYSAQGVTPPPAPTGYSDQGVTPPPAPTASTELVTNGPQANVENAHPNWSARQNVMESHRYTRLVETDPAFRHARMRQECSPITDPQLHESCIASFNNQYE